MRGHLFVVHGLLESVRHDVAVVPTSGDFRLREYWRPVLGGSRHGHRPPTWRDERPEFGRSNLTDRIWFLSVSGLVGDRVVGLVERACRLVKEIAAQNPVSGIGRARPLIAVPGVGSAGGGLGADRGRLLRKLILALQSTAESCEVDVALVIRDTSMYAAAQHVRRTLGAPWPVDVGGARHAERLGRLAKEGELALFLGAGVSMGAGLPGWEDLLRSLSRDGDDVSFEELKNLSALDQAQLLALSREEIGRSVKKIIEKQQRPALAHALLAGIGCREAVTTNYDRLYETAIRAAGEQVASVLPQDTVRGAERWILKMHGDVSKPKSIVLTREHFVRYDAQARPSASTLQALFVTRHVLVIGASMTDDNVVRLAYEVHEYRSNAGHKDQYGTVLSVSARKAMQRLWKDQMHWVEMPGAEMEDRTRSLEIFLDAVAAHATSDASWLLDERFTHLQRMDHGIAEQARELYRSMPADGPWGPLRAALEQLGVQHKVSDE